MCSVYGALVAATTPSELRRISTTFGRARQRGRDSWGLYALSGDHVTPVGVSTTGAGEPEVTRLRVSQCPLALIGNRRAEPTTEWVLHKRREDVQPFRSDGGWLYSHNGTIANDRELLQSLRAHPAFGEPETAIDAAAIGVALDCLGWEEGIRSLKGSFAIVAAHVSEPGTLYFAGNYKPLFIQSDRDGTLVQIASQREFFPATAHPLRDPQPVEIPPYSIGRVTPDGRLHTRSLYPGVRRSRVLAVCSGGLDSTVAAWQHHTQGDDVTLLHVDYACKAGKREQEAVERIARRMERPSVVLRTDFFATAAESSLTDSERNIRSDRGGESGAEFGYEWVPARNLVLLSLAFAYAEAHEFDTITLGTNLEESGGGYPDNEQEFINKVGHLSPYALKPYHELRLSQPCGTLMKHEIVRLGHSLGAPIELTWSCYRGGVAHCGTCGPCWMRQVGHLMNGLVDPVFADTWPEIEQKFAAAAAARTSEAPAIPTSTLVPSA